MDLKDLKNLVRNGERAIIVEDGKPTLVVLSFEEYGKSVSIPGGQQRIGPVINGNGMAENDDIALPEEEFTLDDLPLE